MLKNEIKSFIIELNSFFLQINEINMVFERIEIMKKDKKGFTLAEVLVALTILGIVAVLVVPGLTNKSQTIAKRVKIKKALSVYESAINTIITENNLPQTTSSLDSFIKNDDECSNAYKYFKAIKKNGCQFKTSDGLWWDVGTNATMSNAIVAFKNAADLKKAKASSYTDYSAFYFITDFDDFGTPRILDLNYGYNAPDILQVVFTSKIVAFLEGKDINDVFRLCGSVLKNCIERELKYGQDRIYNSNGVSAEQFGSIHPADGGGFNILKRNPSYFDSKGRKVGCITTFDMKDNALSSQFNYSPQWNDMPSEQKEALVGYIREKYGDEVANDIKWSYGGGPEIRVIEKGQLNQMSSSYDDVTRAFFVIRTNTHGNLEFNVNKIEGFDLFDW